MRRALAELARVMDTAPVEHERKYLLAEPPDLTDSVFCDAVAIEIEQTYLCSADPDAEIRVRKRSQDGQATFFWTAKRPAPGGREEREAVIRPAECRRLLAEADPNPCGSQDPLALCLPRPVP